MGIIYRQYHNTTQHNNKCEHHRSTAKYCLVRSLIKMKEKQLNSVHAIRFDIRKLYGGK